MPKPKLNAGWDDLTYQLATLDFQIDDTLITTQRKAALSVVDASKRTSKYVFLLCPQADPVHITPF